MALRQSLAAALVPLLFAACGESKGTPAGGAGSSPQGVIQATAGAGTSGGSSSGSGAASPNSVAGASAGNVGGAVQGSNAGQAGTAGNGGNDVAAAGQEAGGAANGGVASGAGSGGMVASGIPLDWIPVTGVDASQVPGPNFETVRYMFKGLPCSGSNCHFGGRNHLQVDKTADALYTYMMSFKTLECGKLIDPANPSQSALVKYLRGPCGTIDRMPLDKCTDDGDELCVPEYYIRFIEQWIAAGAPRN